MNFRTGLLVYLPPPKVPHTALFIDHFKSVKVNTEVLAYSEFDWKFPGQRMLKGDPEKFRNAQTPDGKINRFAIPNVTFFSGLRIAMMEGFSHVLVVEPDCRFGRDYWDMDIWDEYFNLGFPCIAAGTLATYNPCNFSALATRKWEKLVARNAQDGGALGHVPTDPQARRNFPIATYGWLGAGVKGPTMVFPNGALAVYDMNWMKRLFDLNNTVPLSTMVTAWDFTIGQRIWDVFAELSYDVVGHLKCIFSGYGEIVSTEQDRQRMLKEGKIIAGHQYKSAWVP